MADEESFLDEDVAVGQDSEVGQKVGFLPALVLKVLKWAAVGVAAVIFIVTVVWITMRVMNQGRPSGSVPVISEEYRAAPEILSYYKNFDSVRTRTADDTPHTVIAAVALGYEEDNKTIQTELVSRTVSLQHIIRSYFSSKTAKELGNEKVVLEELLERVNSVVSGGKIKEVLLLEYNIIAM
ncbi:MAG: flagellar basal body-associated protein FliL [Spirochaetales bacterium]|jgi:flagellar protein FliL|nr:flagellar basal body-associated protein FliL [Spirochaetales bacterium]